MDIRRRLHRAGLLIMKKFIFLFAVFAGSIAWGILLPDIWAQDAGPMVSVTISPGRTTVPPFIDTDSPFTLIFIIDHPDPEEVDITAPPFPAEISLDRLVKRPRTAEAQTQTVAEFRFLAETSGRIMLNSFTVSTPNGTALTGPFFLNVSAPTRQQPALSPRLFWDGAPAQIAAGQRTILTLRAGSWNAQQPPSSFFTPEPPPGVILSLQPLSAAEREGGVVFKLLLIPLAPGVFNLPARVLQYENIRFEIPPLRIQAVDYR